MGQRDDIELLLQSVREPLERYLRRRMNRVDADEVLAETMRILWAKEDKIPPGGEIPWSIAVAKNVEANHRRSQRRRENLARRIADTSVLETMPSDTRAVTEALDRLEPGDRELLRLWAWEGLEASEIAVIENCTANTAAARLSRARKRLRRALETGGHETFREQSQTTVHRKHVSEGPSTERTRRAP